jgi:hypothetical protein
MHDLGCVDAGDEHANVRHLGLWRYAMVRSWPLPPAYPLAASWGILGRADVPGRADFSTMRRRTDVSIRAGRALGAWMRCGGVGDPDEAARWCLIRASRTVARAAGSVRRARPP